MSDLGFSGSGFGINMGLGISGGLGLNLEFGIKSAEKIIAKPSTNDVERLAARLERRGAALDNMFLMDCANYNNWGIPETKPFVGDLTGIVWVEFCNIAGIKDFSNIGIHFYVDDYKFNIIWNKPDKWLNIFKQCRAVISPDFSVYTDMAKAQQLWNHYRRQWLAKYWQDNGVNVVSSITWDLLDPQPWALYGISKGTSIARSFVSRQMKEERIDGFIRAVEVLEPHKIYLKCSSTDEAELRRYFDFEIIPPYRRR